MKKLAFLNKKGQNFHNQEYCKNVIDEGLRWLCLPHWGERKVAQKVADYLPLTSLLIFLYLGFWSIIILPCFSNFFWGIFFDPTSLLFWWFSECLMHWCIYDIMCRLFMIGAWVRAWLMDWCVDYLGCVFLTELNWTKH